MAGEDARGPTGKRRIDVDRDLRQLALGHQPREVDDQLLRALHREGRDQQRAVRMDRGPDLVAQCRAAGLVGCLGPVGVAVGRLADDIVEIARRLGIGMQQLEVGADVAGEQQPQRPVRACPCRGDLDLDRSRAEQVARVPEPCPDAGKDAEPAIIGFRPEEREAGVGVRARVDRFDRLLAPARLAPVQLLDLDGLDMGAVGQHDAGEIGGGGRRVDRTGKAVLDQFRQQAAVIDVRMAQDHGRDVDRPEREWPIVQLFLRLRPLKHAAVDQQLARARLQTEARAGDSSGSAVEGQAWRHRRS